MKNSLEALQQLQDKHDYLEISLDKAPDMVQSININDIFSFPHDIYVLHKDVYLLKVSYGGELNFQCKLVIPSDYSDKDINKILGCALTDSVKTAIPSEEISWRELYRDIQEIFGK